MAVPLYGRRNLYTNKLHKNKHWTKNSTKSDSFTEMQFFSPPVLFPFKVNGYTSKGRNFIFFLPNLTRNNFESCFSSNWEEKIQFALRIWSQLFLFRADSSSEDTVILPIIWEVTKVVSLCNKNLAEC